MRTSLIALACALILTTLFAAGMLDPLDLPARDLVLRLLPKRPPTRTVVVAIDERSLHEIGPWPWPRERIAQLVDGCRGARAVVLDVLLTDARAGDDALAVALHGTPSIAVSVLDDRGDWLLPSPALRAATTPAHGNFEVDHDGILRRLASTKQSRDRALAAVSVQAASFVADAPVPVGLVIAPAFRTPASTIPQRSAADVIRGGADLRGRIAFIGPTALALGDRVLTPTSRRGRPDPGVTVHAAATESLLRNERLRTLPPLASGVLAAIGIATLLAFGRNRARRIGAAAVLATLLILGSAWSLAAVNVAIPFFSLLLTLLLAAAAMEASAIRHALYHGHLAAARMETRLGMSHAERSDDEVGARLLAIDARLAEHREREAQAKRLLAHELKTPLASMRGLTQLLSGFDLNAEERQRVAMLLGEEAGKLESLVGTLLDLERLALRDFAASASVLDLSELVRNRIAFLGSSTSRRLVAEGEAGVFVRADRALVERIVDNLVGNALKYTPPDSPVTIRVARDGDAARIDVSDRGPGIAPADRERIFERFVRGATAAGTQGLGLGLSFVSEIAKWHGGGIAVDDADGGGARFRVRLPLVAEAH